MPEISNREGDGIRLFTLALVRAMLGYADHGTLYPRDRADEPDVVAMMRRRVNNMSRSHTVALAADLGRYALAAMGVQHATDQPLPPETIPVAEIRASLSTRIAALSRDTSGDEVTAAEIVQALIGELTGELPPGNLNEVPAPVAELVDSAEDAFDLVLALALLAANYLKSALRDNVVRALDAQAAELMTSPN